MLKSKNKIKNCRGILIQSTELIRKCYCSFRSQILILFLKLLKKLLCLMLSSILYIIGPIYIIYVFTIYMKVDCVNFL